VTRARDIVFVGLALSGAVALGLALTAGAGHAIARATGGAAITLLSISLAMSPIAQLVSAPSAVACRAARRTLGIASATVALAHALWALPTYLAPLTLSPIGALPWLRQGALALLLLLSLLVTSFPVLQRALAVRAWSALHRLAYLAAILASLHALGVPFGSSTVGIAACTATVVVLLARPLVLVLRRRPRASGEKDPQNEPETTID